MDASVARRLAQGLKTHKRKDASTSGLVKKARIEGTSSTAPAQVAIAVDVPSDVEPEVPRALSRSPPIEDPALEARPEGHQGPKRGGERRSWSERAAVARLPSRGPTALNKIWGKISSTNRDLIKRLVEGCILPEVVQRIVLTDPELRVWDSLGSFLEVG